MKLRLELQFSKRGRRSRCYCCCSCCSRRHGYKIQTKNDRRPEGRDRTGKRRNAEQLWKKKKSSRGSTSTSTSSNAVQAHHCLISNLITRTNFGGLKSKSILQRDDLESINFALQGNPLFKKYNKLVFNQRINKYLHMDLEYVDFLFMLKSTKNYTSILSSNHLLIMPKSF
jgi:hypothetical protein